MSKSEATGNWKPCSFTESNVRRIIRATKSAGVVIDRIELQSDGRVIVFPKETGGAVNEPVTINGDKETDANPWDKVLGHAD